MSETLYISNKENGLSFHTSPVGGRVEDIDKAWAEAEAMRPDMDKALAAKKRGAVALKKLNIGGHDYWDKAALDRAHEIATKDEVLNRQFANNAAYFAGRRYDVEHSPTDTSAAQQTSSVEGTTTAPEDEGSIPAEILAQVPDDMKGLSVFFESRLKGNFDKSQAPLWAAFLAKKLQKQASFAPEGVRYPGGAFGVLGIGEEPRYLQAMLGEISGKPLSEDEFKRLPFSEIAKAFGFDVRNIVPDYEQRFNEDMFKHPQSS